MENDNILTFFETLPDVPLSTIFQYLSPHKLIMVSLQSPNWKQYCSNQLRSAKLENELHLELDEDLEIEFERLESNGNIFNMESIAVFFEVPKGDVMREDFSCYSKNFANSALFIRCKSKKVMEELYKNVFDILVSSVQPIKLTAEIKVDANGETEHFNLWKYLLKDQMVKRMVVGKKYYDDERVIVNVARINELVMSVKTVDSLNMQCPPGGAINYGNSLRNARISQTGGFHRNLLHLNKINCKEYSMYQFSFRYAPTEQINTFLRSWQSGGNENVRKIKFEFSGYPSSFQEMKMLEGLDAKSWNPQRREAGILEDTQPSKNALSLIDLGNGKDIIRHDGVIGTVLLQTRRGYTIFQFFVWTDLFPWRNRRKSLRQRLVECEEFLAHVDQRLLAEIEQKRKETYPKWREHLQPFDESEMYKTANENEKRIMDELMVQAELQFTFKTYGP